MNKNMTDPLPHSVAPRGQDGQESGDIRLLIRNLRAREELFSAMSDLIDSCTNSRGQSMSPSPHVVAAARAALAKARGETT